MDKKEAIRAWWAASPMTYGDQHGDTDYRRADGGMERVTIGTRRFYELADETFYRWNAPLHVGGRPFAKIFDYDRYRGAPILEVGCGMGCMAMNWAQNGAIVTAVDLNPVATAQTTRRFAEFGLPGDIRESDGEVLPFADKSFDFAYSWGVLHHSPGTRRSIAELYRVLRPGGRVGVMLYHRHSMLYQFLVRFQEGWINLERSFLSEVELASRYGDGDRAEGNPHTWPVTKAEVYGELFPQYEDVAVKVLGTDVPNVMAGWVPGGLALRMPESWVRALARRWGWSLWITARKQA